MAIREKRLKVSLWLNDDPARPQYSYVADQSHPMLSPSLYNQHDRDITVTIPAKTAVYLKGLFPDNKYGGNVECEVTDTHVTVRMPIRAGRAVFATGKADPL